ncbi:Sodium/calcium exchanger protein [Methanosarcina siciliae T4/M]|uniref:Sodium/calcium exchanger protein n=2 Tax=Methanosarcina siciliae TaxID=38027 RepID=A0A0E3PBQ2_9EURY|nr:calcium/sodium antiporter [Methanosarcina siciliae]AKB27616.1 Sodium/calcium exchanger protein [Methanosarcina siciliae T4/M]AKB31554.1 Sodium/calcium exchanger protein [Methanosarcina siciliae HI350]
MYLVDVLIFVGGLLLLVKGADLFVMSSSLIAERFGVSEFIIGLTLVSIGTSVPELASSLTASFEHANGIVIGNVLGSNIANIGLIVSTAALLSNVRTEELMLRRDGYIMFFSLFLFLLFILDFRISRLEALIFLLFYFVYLLFLLDKVKKHEEDIYFKDFMNYFFKFEYIFDLKARIETGIRGRIEVKNGIGIKTETDIRSENGTEIEIEKESKSEIKNLSESSLLIELIKLIVSGIAIIVGAKYFIEQSIFFALLLEIPETLIGISLVAIGTSLPELMVTISAARSGYASIALGNVIGSNITNTLLILGFSGLVNPLTVTKISIYYITPFMLFISLLLLLFIRTGWRIKRTEGVILLLLYCGFMFSIFRIG